MRETSSFKNAKAINLGANILLAWHWKLGMVRSALIGKRFNEPFSEDVTTDEYGVRFLTSYKTNTNKVG